MRATITTGATADGTLYLPPGRFATGTHVAERLLVYPTADPKRRAVLRTSIRVAAGDVAGLSPRTFHALGGRSQEELACTAERARWWHVLRYVDGAALACAIAVLSFASAAFSGWFGLRDGLAKVDGSHAAFVVIAAAFVVNALLALLTATRALSEV